MPTPTSTSIPYASGADLRARHDFRQLGDMLDDTGVRITSTSQFDSSSEVTTALMDASGMIEMACLKANKYSVQDLTSLIGASKNLLTKLCVELAWGQLYDRRHSGKPMLPSTLWSFSVLDAIESGDKVFGLTAQMDAGNPSDNFLTQQEYTTLNLASTQARRLFGSLARERVPGTATQLGGPGTCDNDGC